MATVRERIRSVRSCDGDPKEDLDGTGTHRHQHRPEENVPLSEPMSWYPPLAPPTGTKKDVFHVDKFKDIDARAANAPRELIRSFRDLVTYLTSDLTSDLEKVRAIFSWMAAQQLAMADANEYSSHPSPSSPEFIMKEAAGGKRDAFAVLFGHLCRKAGVPCMTVRGLVKAAAYEPGHVDTCGTSHWSIVYVQGGWRFVHSLWAFRFIQHYSRGIWMEIEDGGHAKREKRQKDQGEVKGQMDEFWFLTDPEDFNFLCHADETEAGGCKQLLPEPWSTDLFLGLPGLKVDFFKSPWKLLSPNKAVVETKKGKCCIDFQHPKESKAELQYKLLFNEGQSHGQLSPHLQSLLFITRLKSGSGVISLVTRLPVVGLYKLEVSGILDGGPPSLLGQFCLVCDAVDSNLRPFPSNPDNGFGFDEESEAAGIHNPSTTDAVQLVQARQTMDFTFEVDEHRELQPQLKHGLKTTEELARHVTLRRNHRHVSIAVTLPDDDADPEYSLEIYVGGRRSPVQRPLPRETEDKRGGQQHTKDEGQKQSSDKVSGSISRRQSSQESDVQNPNGSTSFHQAADPAAAIPTNNYSVITNSKSDKGGPCGTPSKQDSFISQSVSTSSSEIHNSYKAGNSTLDPSSSAQNQSTDSGFAGSEIFNSYKGGNSQFDPVSQADDSSGGVGLLVNALNYLLTGDKQLHAESSSETKELHRELQEALDSGDELSIRDALRRFLEAGLDNPIAIAKARAKERTFDKTREKVKKAAEDKSMGRINRAIGDFKTNKMQDTGELQSAVDRLMALSERAIKSALTSRSIPELDTALKRVRSSHVARRARATNWFREAQVLRTDTAVRELCEEATNKLETPGVVGLGMEDKPLTRPLHRILAATLALLGEDEEVLKNSHSIKNRVRETSAGRSHILERIKNFTVQQTTKCHVTRAEEELSGCMDKRLEKDCGVTARRLHDWCRGMVKELNFHIWDDEDDDENNDDDGEEIIDNDASV